MTRHRLDIMCFTKYLVGVNSQNLMSCHRLVGVNSHSIQIKVLTHVFFQVAILAIE